MRDSFAHRVMPLEWTGSQVWSWTLPERRGLMRAVMKDGDAIVLHSNDHHLHRLNYSELFKGRVTREELLAHLHSYRSHPKAITFMFSFCDRKWAVCLQHARVEVLTAEVYDVDIDCRREDGTSVSCPRCCPVRVPRRF